MNDSIEGAYSIGRAILKEVRREDVTFMAASIAYHAFVSMLPVLVLLTVVASAVGSEALATAVLDVVKGFLPEVGRLVVEQGLEDANASVGASAVGLLALLWGTAKIFRAMDAAFAEIYDTERKVSLLDQFRDAVVVVFALAVGVAALVAVDTVFALPSNVPFRGAMQVVLGVVGLAFVFFPMYYVFPDIDVTAREVVPGVVVVAVSWIGLKWLFGLYLALSTKPDAYGFVGTIVVLITWLYAGGLALLLGAAINATLAGRGTARTDRGGKRRFGRQVTDVDGFERRLDDLIDEARDADVPETAIWWALGRRSGDHGDPDDHRDPSDTATAGTEGR